MPAEAPPALAVSHDLPPVVRAGEPVHWSVAFVPGEPLPAGTQIMLGRNWPSDWGKPQWEAPDRPNHIRLREPAPVALSARRELAFHPYDHLIVLTLGEDLPAGSRLALAFGADGGPGFEVQTFIEDACTMRVLLARPGEPAGPVGSIVTRVVGAAPDRLVVTAPSEVRPGERFDLHVRIEDRWGNPASDVDEVVRAEGFGGGARLASRDGAACRLRVGPLADGIHRIAVEEGSGRFRAVSNPVRCRPGDTRLYWGDLHAQSSIGCGAQSIARYYAFARDFAAIDFGGHQGNCFLISRAEWEESKAVTKAVNADGRFVALLGYEWSGPTAIGGDHNVYFPGEDGEMRRCSHRFVADISDIGTDLPHVTDLHEHVRGKDMLLALHVGGSTSNLDWHEPTTERLLEVHSTHATSEWLIAEAMRRGYRFGFTGGSDGVDGRLGASHPGRHSVRNLRGGLTAVAMPALTRADLWSALRARRTYATNGPRILIDLHVAGGDAGEAATTQAPPRFCVSVEGTAPLRSVELFRGEKRVAAAPIAPADPTPSGWLRLSWRGAAGRGNWTQSRLVWDGSLAVTGGVIGEARDYASDSPAEGITGRSERRLDWTSITAGNCNGVEFRLDEGPDTVLSVRTAPLSADFPLRALGSEAIEVHGQDADCRLRIERLPRRAAPLGWSGELVDETAGPGAPAYWLRVCQDDAGMAWLSVDPGAFRS